MSKGGDSGDGDLDVALVGGPFGQGARIAVETDELHWMARTCLGAQAEIDAAESRVRAGLRDAEFEVLRNALLVPPWTMLETRSVLSAAAGFSPGIVGAPGATWHSGDGGQRLREVARGLNTVADSYEEVERRNSSWQRSGAMSWGEFVEKWRVDVPASSPEARRAWASKAVVNVVDTLILGSEQVAAVGGRLPDWMYAADRVLAKSEVNAPVSGLGSLYAFAASLYRDRGGEIAGKDVFTGADQPPPPKTLTDLYASLEYRKLGEKGELPAGRVLVQHLQFEADGHPQDRYIVSLSGTSDWDLPGLDRNQDIRDVNAIGRSLAGAPSAEVDALEQVLRDAHVPATAPILLVGHSLGGINAARAAGDPKLRSKYRFTHVLTAGSPIQRVPVPASTRVLSLVNRMDLVPLAAAAPDPDAANRSTVRFTGPEKAHDVPTYLEAARATDERVAQVRRDGARDDTDRGYLELDDSLRRAGFLSDTASPAQVTATRYEVQYAESAQPSPQSGPQPNPEPSPHPSSEPTPEPSAQPGVMPGSRGHSSVANGAAPR